MSDDSFDINKNSAMNKFIKYLVLPWAIVATIFCIIVLLSMAGN